MHQVMVIGAGKIGSLIACLLADSKDYEIHLADVAFDSPDVKKLLHVQPEIKTVALDVHEIDALKAYIKRNQIQAVISSLPFFLNTKVAIAAKETDAHYFDLTEDTAVTEAIKSIALDAKSAFVPQCGLAPGFISIAANSLMQTFDECLHANLRVGALPERANNALHYSITWSTDGLINEYGNPCHAIKQGQLVNLAPLEELESIQIDGALYEAFNTSGGLGSLSELYLGKIQSLNYKTIRYPGHCNKIRFLMNDLRLNDDRETLKRILERAIPKTYQDIVIVYISVEGMEQGELREKSYVKKIYPTVIHNLEWGAIQISTAASLCAVVDLVLNQTEKVPGFILQETFELETFLANRFGKYYQ